MEAEIRHRRALGTTQNPVSPLIAEGATPVYCPANSKLQIGIVRTSSLDDLESVIPGAHLAQPAWDQTGAGARAQLLLHFANLLEDHTSQLVALLSLEAGKTLPDAIAEVREAVDFTRYYATQAMNLFNQDIELPGPTGESNLLSLHGKGVWACISPWNFPLAIFTGQIVAALVTGNAVIAKPAQETPLIATFAIELIHQAGVPYDVCQLILGAADVGHYLVSHKLIAGVAFTGSTQTARKINVSMAQVERPIATLIAETGGQNAMIVDSTALLDQVTDDVIQSAFSSAGQRCSALRVLYLQADIAAQALEMIRGAMDQLTIGDPSSANTDVGPIISASAADKLNQHIGQMRQRQNKIYQTDLPSDCAAGHFIPPTLIEIKSISELNQEHFGPILHVISFPADKFSAVVREINTSGYGLTLGLHTRIDARIKSTFNAVNVGNMYTNRNMIGAVVGTQPFGGQGLSGTGPKAGGPNYLIRFATEKVLTVNTAATGGNAKLLSL